MKNSKILSIAQTAIFLALLVILQYISKPWGQYVTGSLVNFVLIASVLTVGLAGGLTVAVLSPVLAFFIGIGPAFPVILPIIMLGNATIVAVYALILKRAGGERKLGLWAAAIVAGAAAKFAVLYLGVVQIALPMIPGLKPQQIAVLSASFSWPQLVTALIGGAIAMAAVPPVLRAVRKQR